VNVIGDVVAFAATPPPHLVVHPSRRRAIVICKGSRGDLFSDFSQFMPRVRRLLFVPHVPEEA